jgi:dTMP kinase
MTHPCAGKFIVFDGPDGSGKTTQRDLLANQLSEESVDVVVCKDPGGTVIGDRVRHILLDYDLAEMDVRCETLLFMASRAQLLGQVIEPALREGRTVLCDRFVSSTCAYQVAAGYGADRVLDLAPFAIDRTWPDLTLVFDVAAEVGLERAGRKVHHAGKNRKNDVGQHSMFDDAVPDAMEARPVAFHRKVRDAFLALSEHYPGLVKVINAERSEKEIHRDVLLILEELFA